MSNRNWNTAANRKLMHDRTRRAANMVKLQTRHALDAEERRMYIKDHRDLCKLAVLIKQNRLSTAWSFFTRLDTAVADEVPSSVYNFLTSDNT